MSDSQHHDQQNVVVDFVHNPKVANANSPEVVISGHLHDSVRTWIVGQQLDGPHNPLLIELDPRTKQVVWTFDQFQTFGNSVPNTQLLDVDGEVLR